MLIVQYSVQCLLCRVGRVCVITAEEATVCVQGCHTPHDTWFTFHNSPNWNVYQYVVIGNQCMRVQTGLPQGLQTLVCYSTGQSLLLAAYRVPIYMQQTVLQLIDVCIAPGWPTQIFHTFRGECNMVQYFSLFNIKFSLPPVYTCIPYITLRLSRTNILN